MSWIPLDIDLLSLEMPTLLRDLGSDLLREQRAAENGPGAVARAAASMEGTDWLDSIRTVRVGATHREQGTEHSCCMYRGSQSTEHSMPPRAACWTDSLLDWQQLINNSIESGMCDRPRRLVAHALHGLEQILNPIHHIMGKGDLAKVHSCVYGCLRHSR